MPDASPRDLLSDLNDGLGHLAMAVKRSSERKRPDVGSVPFGVWGLADDASIFYAALL